MADQKQATILVGITLESGQVLAPGVQVMATDTQVQAWVDAGLACCPGVQPGAAPTTPVTPPKRTRRIALPE